MILNFIVILFILVTALTWGSKARGYGLFSAFLAFACTLVAGAVAFGLWEVVAGAMLSAGKDNSSFLGQMLQDTAWGLGLLLPFMVTLLVLRLAVDSIVKSNLDASETTNMIGGMAFGALSAALTAGIFVLAAGYTRLPPRLLGYEPIADKNGNLIYEKRLWVPVDTLTVGLYERLSTGAFRNATPLAVVRPAAAEGAGMQRMTYKGQTRSAILPEQFEIVGEYRIEGPVDALRGDDFLPARPQSVAYPDESAPPNGSVLYGFIVRLDAGAKEKGGNIIVTPGQVRLISERAGEPSLALHPIAVVAKPEPGSPHALYRFRFDARESSIASGAGESEALFAFEFLVPPGATPSYLLVKNARATVPGQPRQFATPLARDDAVRSQSIFESAGAGGGPLDTSGSQRIALDESGTHPDIQSNTFLPNNRAFNKTIRGNINLNDDNQIIAGENVFERASLEERGIDRNLRVDKFSETRDTSVIQVRLSEGGDRSVFGRVVEAALTDQRVTLVDENGNRYDPIGFYYDDGSLVTIRFTPDRPIRTIGDAPTLSRTARNQSLTLVFRPTKGVKIVGFAIGDREVLNFRPNGITLR